MFFSVVMNSFDAIKPSKEIREAVPSCIPEGQPELLLVQEGQAENIFHAESLVLHP